MYEISINLPAEFINPPMYLLRHESKPRVLAQRIAMGVRPTLRGKVTSSAPAATVALSPASAAAVRPAYRMPVTASGQPAVVVRPIGPQAMTAGTRMSTAQTQFQVPGARRMAAAAGVRAVMTPAGGQAPAAGTPVRRVPIRGQRRGSGLF